MISITAKESFLSCDACGDHAGTLIVLSDGRDFFAEWKHVSTRDEAIELARDVCAKQWPESVAAIDFEHLAYEGDIDG